MKRRRVFSEDEIEDVRSMILKLEGIRGKRGGRAGEGGGSKRKRGSSRRGAADEDEDEDWGYGRQSILSKQEASRMEGWLEGASEQQKIDEPWPNLPSHVLQAALEYAMKEDADANAGGLTEKMTKEKYPAYFEAVSEPITFSDIRSTPAYTSQATNLQAAVRLMLSNAEAYHGPDNKTTREVRRQVALFTHHLRRACLDCDLFLKKDGTTEVCLSEDEDGVGGGRGSDSDEEHYEAPVIQRRRRATGSGKGIPRLIRCGECAACKAPDCRKCSHCLDMPKYGGPGTTRRPCKNRVCNNKRMSVASVKKAKREARRAANGAAYKDDDDNDEDDNVFETKPKRAKKEKIEVQRHLLLPKTHDYSADPERPVMYDLQAVIALERSLWVPETTTYTEVRSWFVGLGQWAVPPALSGVEGAEGPVAALLADKVTGPCNPGYHCLGPVNVR